MTLDEKIEYLGGTGFVEGKKIGKTKALKHLGIPAVKETKGFKRVSLKTHETKQVEMTIDKNDLSFWSEIQRDWQVEDGTFNVLVGTSSADINLKASFNYFYQRKD
jgi:beta-glucosidase